MAHSSETKSSGSTYIAKLSSMTLDQKLTLISGKDFWTTVAIPEADIPQLKLTDGPIGARGDLGVFTPSACFPSGVGIGATWNPELVAEIANALAEETKLKGAHVLLGPTINLQRTPIGGRNFECYSEDPHLTAELAISYVNALQAGGVGACPKHYVGNDTEFERFFISSNIDDTTLHEVYLHPFERLTRETKPWMIMAAYNSINGIQACSHKLLNIDYLKDRWGFDGVLVSDWFAARDTVGNANGGLDLEMPGPTRVWGADLKQAIEKGDVSESVLDDKVLRILRLMDRTQPAPKLQAETGFDKPEHRALIRRAATEAMVLLKNEAKTLPLAAERVTSLAVIGPNAQVGQIMGGGSAFVNSHPPVHPLDGLEAAFPDADVKHAVGCTNYKFLPAFKAGTIKTDDGKEGFAEARYASEDLSGDPLSTSTIGLSGLAMTSASIDADGPIAKSLRLIGHFTPTHSGPRELGLFSAGQARMLIDNELVIDNWTDWKTGESFFGFGSNEIRAPFTFTEGQSYKITIEYLRSPGSIIAGLQFGINTPLEDDPIAHAARIAASCEQTVLVLGSNADWESEGHDRTDMTLPGDQDALAEAVLAANPNTIVVMNVGSPVTMPWYDKAKAVLVTWFPGEEMGNALADIITGKSEPSGRLPFTWPKRLEDHPAFATYPGKDFQMEYEEKRLIGHRWYDAKGIMPLAPFGYGLGYADVAIDEVEIKESSSNTVVATASVSLTNASARPTQTVVQIYASDHKSGADDTPPQKLVSFAKVSLEANSSATVAVDILAASVAEWSPEQGESIANNNLKYSAGLSSASLIQARE